MDYADTQDATPEAPAVTDEEAVAKAIEQDIIFGRLGPGEPLREESLAKQHNASRHHVRSALMILERAGTVVRERNKGARVRAYSGREVRQLYDVRELLTRQAALRIPLPVAPEAIARMEKVQAEYEAAIDRRNLPEIHELNDRFHMEFFGLCENPYLVELLKRCMDMTRVIRAANMADTDRMESSRDEHRALIDLLKGGDAWALSELCVQHLRPSKEFYLTRLDEEADEPSRKRSR